MEKPFEKFPTLETERLILRKVTWDDIEDIHAYSSNEEVTKYVTWETHKTLADTKEFIEFAFTQYENKHIAPWGIQNSV